MKSVRWNWLLIRALLGLFAMSGLTSSAQTGPASTWQTLRPYSLEGLQVAFQPSQGKVLMLLFWDTTSWRTDEATRWALEMYQQYHDQGLEILGVCTDPLEAEVMEYCEHWDIPWPQVANHLDNDSKLTELCAVQQLPGAVLIGKQHEILCANVSFPETAQKIAEIFGIESPQTPRPTSVHASDKKDWGPEQAAGAPDTLEAGDFATAWAALVPDGSEEWLELTYDQPVRATVIVIYESYNPGAVSRVHVFSTDNTESVAWEGRDPVQAVQGKGITTIRTQDPKEINRVRIDLDCKNHPGSNAIDAVGLVDESGVTHWAADAKASSSFADSILFDESDNSYLFPTERTLTSFSQVRDHETALTQMKAAASSETKTTQSYRYHIKTFIEGTSVLLLRRNTARWYHAGKPLPGVQPANNYPTYINGVEWFPQWENAQVSWSSIFTQVSPALPSGGIQASLKNPQVKSTNCGAEMNDDTFGFAGMIGQAPKGAIYMLQAPTQENDYTMAIAFDDFGLGGTNIFECYVNVRIGEQEEKSIAQK